MRAIKIGFPCTLTYVEMEQTSDGVSPDARSSCILELYSKPGQGMGISVNFRKKGERIRIIPRFCFSHERLKGSVCRGMYLPVDLERGTSS